MDYISSDTNVWIDYMTIGKLEYPFKLPYKYLMNEDAICDELLSPQGMKDKLIGFGLVGTSLSEKEFYYALDIAGKYPKLSEYDRAALAIAKMRKIVLMSGDAALKKAAISEGVIVIGTIGILDKLFEQHLIDSAEYKECLIMLIKYNGREIRLPQAELQNRLELMDKQ